MRRVSLVLLLALWAGAAQADPFSIASARYEAPTERYPHGALGDPIEWGALVLQSETGAVRRLTLPESAVFEDTAPRLFDVDRDGMMEVIAVESDTKRCARLAIYGPDGMIAATPYIGTRFRWLAPLVAADLDGDGWIEIAYIDRPHLAKVLRVWRFENGVLHPVAEASGLTNHQFGADVIEGGSEPVADALRWSLPMLIGSRLWRRGSLTGR